ncbi:hypothetical protein CYMTET_14774 [Cymbomonas tetramitiformis]|uniref:Cyclic nucleotide-binding domain-containing protein n=1 Tax=Cymbomonas tetramitiformis TaxID=36881 RepID=A0AAE0L9L2_9CHLO|nr:hypothetical protein CYMTET_14774 [Cymbomonas tetramitiformis]
MARAKAHINKADTSTMVDRLSSLMRKRKVKLMDTELLELCCLVAHFIPCVSTLPLRLQKKFCEAARLVHFPSDVTICREGEASDQFFAIVRGRVLIKSKQFGNMTELKHGATFGEIGIINNLKRSATCIAQGAHVECLSLAAPDYLDLFRAEEAASHYREQVQFLQSRSNAFKNCLEEEAVFFSQAMSEVVHPKDTVFVLDSGMHLFFLVSGKCSLCAWIGSNVPTESAVISKAMKPHLRKLRDLAVGDIFGESVVFHSQKMGWIALADTEIRIYKINKDSFLERVPKSVIGSLEDETAFKNAYVLERSQRLFSQDAVEVEASPHHAAAKPIAAKPMTPRRNSVERMLFGGVDYSDDTDTDSDTEAANMDLRQSMLELKEKSKRGSDGRSGSQHSRAACPRSPVVTRAGWAAPAQLAEPKEWRPSERSPPSSCDKLKGHVFHSPVNPPDGVRAKSLRVPRDAARASPATGAPLPASLKMKTSRSMPIKAYEGRSFDGNAAFERRNSSCTPQKDADTPKKRGLEQRRKSTSQRYFSVMGDRSIVNTIRSPAADNHGLLQKLHGNGDGGLSAMGSHEAPASPVSMSKDAWVKPRRNSIESPL